MQCGEGEKVFSCNSALQLHKKTIHEGAVQGTKRIKDATVVGNISKEHIV